MCSMSLIRLSIDLLKIEDRKPKVKDTGIEIGSVGKKNKAKNENTPVKKPIKIGLGE